MGKQHPDIDLKKIFSLLATDTTQDKKVAQDLKSSFFEAFRRQWEEGNADLRQKMIRFAGGLELENGLRPVLLGVRDHVLRVREETKKSLEMFAQQATVSVKKGQDLPPHVVKRSAEFSFVIYKEMKVATGNVDFMRFFLETLLKIGGRAPYLCWKFFTQGIVPQNIVIEMIRRFPEVLQLMFVHQYTLDNISVRRDFYPSVKTLLKDVKDRNTVVAFLADLFDQDAFLDNVLDDLCQRLQIRESVTQIELRAGQEKDKINGLKVVGLLGQLSDYHSCLPLLSQDELPTVRIACLKMLARANAVEDPKIIEAVSVLLDDKDQNVVLHAFKTLASLKAPGLEKVAYDLSQKYPSMRSSLYELLCDLEWIELNIVLDALPPDQRRDARATIARKIIGNNPEKLMIFLNRYVKSPNDKAREEATKLLERIDSIKRKEIEEASQDNTPESLSTKKTKKGFFEKLTERKRHKELKRLVNREHIEDTKFQGEVLSDIDLSGIDLQGVNFDGAFFSNVNLSSAKLYSVTFKGARFENVKMENALLDSVSFENAVLKGVSSTKASFKSCDFTNSWIYGSSFDSARLNGSLFVNANINKTDFSRSDLTETSFVHSDLARVSFNFAILHLSDFSLVQARICDFSGVDLSTVGRQHADLNTPSALFGDVVIPPFFFENDLLEAGGFDLLVLTEEMDKRREAFIEYNRRRTELAIDTFRPKQGDLFELIPFVIHSNLELLPTDNPIRNAPSGIFGYFPSPKILQLARKYFIIDESRSFSDKGHRIEGLFTIGSLGTVVQSANSDIDYWVCVEEVQLGEEGTKLLHAKLQAIEEWALKAFNIELHFFVVDLASVREDRFGGSDQESSGSAQGMILKEEFYRTMILVAGKVPLWCVAPLWLNDGQYQYILGLSPRFHEDYLDMGNVSTIPRGEYFGASVWQLLKSLKSPYKSVMKMSLLEKYIQDKEGHGMLCNRLKAGWSLEKCDLRRLDPYLLLFEEVLDYYQRTEQENAESLLKVCFFLKLGIRSITDLDKSVIGIRKKVVQDYIDSWGWNEVQVQDLGNFRKWQFDKIFRLSTKINHYMIGTYKKLSRSLRETAVGKTMITQQDLTILGRKMFVQFSKQPHKVEKLPLIVHGKSLFQQLYLQHSQPVEGPATWSLYHLKRGKQRGPNGTKILKKMGRIEEIAIWLVHNGLFLPTTSFELVPNPTPISIQDILDLLRRLYEFFPSKEVEAIPPRALLKKPQVDKLLIAVNFNLSRKLPRIHEYTAFYMTSWGEFFCRVFSDKEGVTTVEGALHRAEEQLDLPISSGQVGFFIPRLARKHIR
jgi:adenylate cyclase class 1